MMYRRAALSLLALLFLLSPQFGSPDPSVDKVLSLYRYADHFFRLTSNTPATDSAGLAGFESVIRLLSTTPDFREKDTILAFSWLKKGILLDGGGRYPQAIAAYRKTLDVHHSDDSISFAASVYAGSAYYNLSNFDSADYFLQKAAVMPPGSRSWEAEVRLYNSLGVLYYDNGNYQQGQNYFNQALRLVEGHPPFDALFAVSLQTNIATCFFRLGEYATALALYKKILGYHLDVHFIYMNMGRTYAALDQYQQAMNSFRLVDAGKIPWVWNEMASTQRQLHRPDSCAWYLDKFHALSLKSPGKISTMDLGINQLYRADWLLDQQQYTAALGSLQQAILVFSRGFTNTDIFSNPTNFTGAFAYFRLFDALFKKAQVFGSLYRTEHKPSWLLASYQAYTAALSLLRYIEKSYDTDDAKLFLKKKSAGAYDGALAVCLQLHRLHPDSAYLEQAFLISEKSKATVIFANLRGNVFTTALSAADDQALKEMRNLKYNIARLNVRSEELADSATMEAIARQRVDYEIQLSRLQKQLERNSAYYKLKYDDSSPGLQEIQHQLGKGQALISFYVAAGTLHTFVLTSRSIFYSADTAVDRLKQEVESWVSMLKMTENGRRFKAGALGDRLYQQLVRPIQAVTSAQDEWIIVPDGFLYYLPFESLPGGQGEDFLLGKTTISYRFSSRLLRATGPRANGPMDILSFAPFADHGAGPDVSGQEVFARLPASRDEIAGLPGAQYIDSSATKANFLKAVNHYPIIHLATHAVSSLNNAAGSFVAFYPERSAPDENNLYLEELYGLNLNATRLVIISACETGQGELAGKEGVISLSRAFAYAGSGSTINSLWKADDKATAFILKRLYVYLEKGYTKAKALQQAKLDYLSGDAINKSPSYWAHLVLMGDTQPLYTSTDWGKWSLPGLALLLGIVAWIVWGRKRKKVGDF
jgi:CHAT domain-containing protein